jgi:hypothetical protein
VLGCSIALVGFRGPVNFFRSDRNTSRPISTATTIFSIHPLAPAERGHGDQDVDYGNEIGTQMTVIDIDLHESNVHGTIPADSRIANFATWVQVVQQPVVWNIAGIDLVNGAC